MEFKTGDTHKIRIYKDLYKIHVMYVLDSHYSDMKLVVFKWYGKHKQWWHHEMMGDEYLEHRIKMANKKGTLADAFFNKEKVRI